MPVSNVTHMTESWLQYASKQYSAAPNKCCSRVFWRLLQLVLRVAGCIPAPHEEGARVHVISISHVTHMDETCRTYQWVMSHTRVSHGCLSRQFGLRGTQGGYFSHMYNTLRTPTKLESSVGVSTLILIKRWGATSTWRSTVWCSVLRCVAVKYSQYVKCGGHLLHRRSTSSK